MDPMMLLGLDDDDADEVGYDDELMGAYLPGNQAAFMGARSRGFPIPRRWGRRAAGVRKRGYRRALKSRLPGAPAEGPKAWPLGFTTSTFTNVSGTTLTSTATPQKPFKGSRLVIDIARTGPTATGLITLDRLDMGTDLQAADTQPQPAGAYAPGAFGVSLALTKIEPGITASAQFTTTVAPGVGDQIDVQPVVIGLSYG